MRVEVRLIKGSISADEECSVESIVECVCVITENEVQVLGDRFNDR